MLLRVSPLVTVSYSACLVVAALLGRLLLHLHADGVADIVGVLLDERLEAVGFQVLAVLLLLLSGLMCMMTSVPTVSFSPR